MYVRYERGDETGRDGIGPGQSRKEQGGRDGEGWEYWEGRRWGWRRGGEAGCRNGDGETKRPTMKDNGGAATGPGPKGGPETQTMEGKRPRRRPHKIDIKEHVVAKRSIRYARSNREKEEEERRAVLPEAVRTRDPISTYESKQDRQRRVVSRDGAKRNGTTTMVHTRAEHSQRKVPRCDEAGTMRVVKKRTPSGV